MNESVEATRGGVRFWEYRCFEQSARRDERDALTGARIQEGLTSRCASGLQTAGALAERTGLAPTGRVQLQAHLRRQGEPNHRISRIDSADE